MRCQRSWQEGESCEHAVVTESVWNTVGRVSYPETAKVIWSLFQFLSKVFPRWRVTTIPALTADALEAQRQPIQKPFHRTLFSPAGITASLQALIDWGLEREKSFQYQGQLVVGLSFGGRCADDAVCLSSQLLSPQKQGRLTPPLPSSRSSSIIRPWATTELREEQPVLWMPPRPHSPSFRGIWIRPSKRRYMLEIILVVYTTVTPFSL